MPVGSCHHLHPGALESMAVAGAGGRVPAGAMSMSLGCRELAPTAGGGLAQPGGADAEISKTGVLQHPCSPGHSHVLCEDFSGEVLLWGSYYSCALCLFWGHKVTEP